jgi:acetyl esterase/lipase
MCHPADRSSRIPVLLMLSLAMLVPTALPAQAADGPPEIILWPDGAPGLSPDEKPEIVVSPDEGIGQRVTKVTAPQLTVYRPAASKNTGAAIVVCPGGGYNILAVQHEGIDVARWLNGIGITGVVLQYRVPRSQHVPFQTPPLQDVQRAIRLVRQHAGPWNLDPQKIGVLGFSAGGNLAALAATNFDRQTYEPRDAADQLNARPDFAVLVYPAYLSREDAPTQLRDEVRVSTETPPTLLIHTGDDHVSALNSIAFYLALREHEVPAEMHIYPRGGHGYGLRESEHAVSTWPARAQRWFGDLLRDRQPPAAE